jgi:hypothetical protein
MCCGFLVRKGFGNGKQAFAGGKKQRDAIPTSPPCQALFESHAADARWFRSFTWEWM